MTLVVPLLHLYSKVFYTNDDLIVSLHSWPTAFPDIAFLCTASKEFNANTPIRQHYLKERVYPSLQRSVSVRSRAGVTITHTPSTLDACETHAQSVEKSIASLILRLC